MRDTSYFDLNPNPLVQFLNKPTTDFTKEDIIRFISEKGIKMVNFRYVGGDSRLKTMNIIINNKKHLDTCLSTGERVDGSSLFSYIEAGSSDLYVIPRFRTAYMNPFSEIPTLDILCSYFNKDGEHLASSPEYVLHKAHKVLKEKTGFSFETMGELEYYIISEKDELFNATDQRGYHESAPYNKWGDFRTEALHLISQCGGYIKYGHSEVGNFSINNLNYEQNEIEFLPVAVEDAADQLVISKWIIRNLAYSYGVNVTFAPKITVGKAGSGMHIHTRLMKDGKNVMVKDGILSDTARKAIAGYLTLAPSLTAFGNTNPTSYFRLVPHQEAPTNICWGDRNRSVLVRVPLGWCGINDMISKANPLEPIPTEDFSDKQTVEFRCPDGSADIYLLMAGLTVAARHGLEMENALQFAEKTYVDVNIFSEKHKEKAKCLQTLPFSCWDSAEILEQQAEIYKKYDVFSQNILEGTVKGLKAYDDRDLREKLKDNKDELLRLVEKYFHCG
ncbi:MAG: glutamine synthetase family protein [Bacteroidales bacterium]|jgi:glutamine synthetase|nr:glutamine synthetase family protein [Bacteroidales bacterium]MDD4215285.1 glutamine synthetase family protein [Bacteroidales bacterium]